MAHQIFNQIQKVKSAASKLQSAKALNFSPDYEGEARLVLNYEVNKLRIAILDARLSHCVAFETDPQDNLKAIDLMYMGY